MNVYYMPMIFISYNRNANMIQYLLIFILTLTILYCSPPPPPEPTTEEKFFSTMTEDNTTTYGNFFSKLAGLRGDLKIKSFTAEGETNPDIKVVEVTIDKKEEKVKYKNLRIQYQFNVKTKFVRVVAIEINGKQESYIMGSMTMSMMMMESMITK